MAQHTFGYISSVIGVSDQNMGRHYGSALRCKLNGRWAILTAFHVIEEVQQEQLGLAISTGYGKQPYVIQARSTLIKLPTWPFIFYPMIILVTQNLSGFRRASIVRWIG